MSTVSALEVEPATAHEGWVSAMERQRQLEQEMSSLGAEAFQRRVQAAQQGGRETETPGGQLLLKTAIQPLAQAIREFVAEASVAKRGRKHRAMVYLADFNPDVAAFLALKRVLDLVSQQMSLTKVSLHIASALEDEKRFTKFEEAAKPLVRVISDDLDKRNADLDWRRTVLVHAMNKAEVQWESWPQVDKLHLGQKLVDLLIRSTGLVRVSHRKIRAKDTEVFLEATEEALALIRERNARCELLSPAFMPMIVEPRRWSSPFRGGYYFSHKPQTLIKTRNRNYLEELKNRREDMPTLYDAINSVQSTAWKINDQVYAVLRHVWDNGVALGGLPAHEDAPLPFCPKCNGVVDAAKKNHQCFEEDKETHTTWRRATARVHYGNVKRKSKLMQVAKVMMLAEKFLDEPAIYFPMQYDFRGRMYAMPMFLNPQGADHAKGLLTFAKGKPINDERAAGWLMIHGANVFGQDKVSLDERIQWTADHTDEIMRVASDPMAHTFWCDADKPWQFLAFCFDYASFQNQGYGYVSSLPVALDGSCNGLQHFSAMLRDPVGGKAVNLLPCEKPNDIYQEVCNVVIAKLTAMCPVDTTGDFSVHTDKLDEARMACQWLDLKPNRALTKRPVMVLPYGGTIFSCREYVLDWLDDQPSHPFGEGTQKAVSFMAKLVWNSITEVVVAARQAMDWLQKAARVAANEGLPVTWTTPDGFHVLQAYPEMESRRIDTKLGEGVIQLSLSQETGQLDKRRQASGISPNYVHSMDATALRLYVCTARDNGLGSFAVIHDSFGTTAADTDVSIACLREAFVSMYLDENHLSNLRESLVAMLPEDKLADLPEVPRMGTLDLEQVRNADYFFA